MPASSRPPHPRRFSLQDINADPTSKGVLMLQLAPSYTPMLTADRWTVLLVEPDPTMRDLFTRILRKRDLHVLPAADSHTALTIARTQSEGIDLVVSEVVLPHVDGLELSQRIVDEHPAARVLFLTDYLESPHVETSLRTSGKRYLPKPFSQRALLDQVQLALHPLRLIRPQS